MRTRASSLMHAIADRLAEWRRTFAAPGSIVGRSATARHECRARAIDGVRVVEGVQSAARLQVFLSPYDAVPEPASLVAVAGLGAVPIRRRTSGR